MFNYIEQLLANKAIRFIAQTIFYFIVLMFLLYMYGYAEHGQGGFIYNEF
ncbi:teichoic acid D-Ala incorporation-associated protein DltX [Periweissella ghanensis]|uniref:Teichoic acid D-Ala incorporation-associated protein DltX n=1 Tax=Periweissella ghanensis TaxID=467997 RepID=A0ABN8BLJ2_9LACO|nr:teichoic acid D-Ala incorporation-associated protein DltX [Periweissella ghanensis]MCM0600864.1 teichoic acid D-Ala incorporation-associated protein DltX [Periweissella ghanensis]CAH0417719.1 hypothetical protein WGH24286_00131 [Periweissella ghanensis]